MNNDCQNIIILNITINNIPIFFRVGHDILHEFDT